MTSVTSTLPSSTQASQPLLPATTISGTPTNKRVSASEIDGTLRKRLQMSLPSVFPHRSWTAVVEETKVPFQLLVDNGIVTPEERKDYLSQLIPSNHRCDFNQQDSDAWATQTLVHLIDKVAVLANACLDKDWQNQILCKRSYSPEAFSAVSSSLCPNLSLCCPTNPYYPDSDRPSDKMCHRMA